MPQEDEYKKVKGVVIYPDWTYQRIVFDSLEKYQTAVGGFIEIVRLKKAVAYVNEDGLNMKELVHNVPATALFNLSGRADEIVGNVIIVGEGGDDGWDSDITWEWLGLIQHFFDENESRINDWDYLLYDNHVVNEDGTPRSVKVWR